MTAAKAHNMALRTALGLWHRMTWYEEEISLLCLFRIYLFIYLLYNCLIVTTTIHNLF